MSYANRGNNIYASEKWENYRDEVKRLAYGNWDQIVPVIAPQLSVAVDKIGQHVSCPRHGGVNGDAFRLFKDFRQTGGATCNSCGYFSDGFKLLQWLYGWGFGEVIRAVGDVVGVRHYRDNMDAPVRSKIDLVPAPPKKTPEEVAREDDQKARRMAEAWHGSVSIMDPIAEPARAYLRKRGITHAVGPLDDLRFHPGMTYFENKVKLGDFPVLLSLLRQPNGNPTTLQRIFLTEQGEKAPVDAPKKVMPLRSTVMFAGSAVRLDHAIGSVLCVTEGVETGMAWRAMTGLPTWATCVAGLMEEVVIPESVQIVIACGDLDPAKGGADVGRGTSAAAKLVARVRESGRKAAAIFPPFSLPEGAVKGVDWNDVLNHYGLEEAKRQPFASQTRSQIADLLEQLGLDWASAHAHY